MSFPRDLFQASYGGVSFLCNVTETRGGRKVIIHEFPNSDTQFVEDLGLKPRVYLLTAIIRDTRRLSYIRSRDSLLRVLEAGIPADLIHPFYGRINNTVVTKFQLKEETTRLGDGEISIQFTQSTNVGSPLAVPNSASILGRIAQVVSSGAINAVSTIFSVNGGDSGNVGDAALKLGDLVTVIRDSIVASPVDLEFLDEFVFAVNDFEGDISTMIFNSTETANRVNNIIVGFSDLYPEPVGRINVLSNMFSFGEGDIEFPQDTNSRIQRQENRDVLNNMINAVPLAQSQVAASQIEFSNVNELNELEDLLEGQYQFIVS